MTTTSVTSRRRHLHWDGCGVVASEAPGGYTHSAGSQQGESSLGESLVGAVDRLVARPVDELDERAIDLELGHVETAMRRLEARRCRLVASAADRQARRAADTAKREGRDQTRARERARREAGNRLAEKHRWTRSDAKRTLETGRQLSANPGPALAAFDAGALPPRHAKLLADTLKYLAGEIRRDAEQRLLAAAERQDAVTFGRTCRRLLAQLDSEAAEHAQRLRNARQRASMATTEDGMLQITGQLSGLDAEYFATAVHAFRRPDQPGEHRRTEQATADALVDMARAALRAADAPEVHGVRPHVTVVLDWQTILAQAGVAEAEWSGPLPFSEIRRLLADCGVSRLLVDPDGVALEAGPEDRAVPPGLWRALRHRDQGCIAEGCDAPVNWTDVMHLDQPYRFEGRLSLANAALGCRHHHRLYDNHGWTVHWNGKRPTLRPPPPTAPRSPS